MGNSKKTKINIEDLKKYFLNFLDYYVEASQKADLPVDKENLFNILNNLKYELVDGFGTGTFFVNRKKISVISENFLKNTSDMNEFYLLHEFVHLISPINQELFLDQNACVEKILKKIKDFNLDNINYTTIYYGLVGVDEVLAQWTTEELNDAMKNKKRSITKYDKGPLNSNVNFKSDFSYKDIYSPLQEPVEYLIKSMGYNDMRDFAKRKLNTENGLLDDLDEESFKKLNSIGMICKGIFLEQGFTKTDATKERVEKVFKDLYVETKKTEQSDDIPDFHE